MRASLKNARKEVFQHRLISVSLQSKQFAYGKFADFAAAKMRGKPMVFRPEGLM